MSSVESIYRSNSDKFWQILEKDIQNLIKKEKYFMSNIEIRSERVEVVLDLVPFNMKDMRTGTDDWCNADRYDVYSQPNGPMKK
jgi:hypothetical protein